MSSRFVSAGTDQAPVSSENDSWGKAKQEVEKQRSARPVEPGQQEGGKSLYEVLQANKAAKQEAFDEATKLRNQFRTLDDSEIEFLDSVRESERLKEDVVKKETADQLDVFRKQRSAVEQAAIDSNDQSAVAEQQPVKDTWTASKKRRRDKGEEDVANKLRKPTVKGQQPQTNVDERTSSADNTAEAIDHAKEKPAMANPEHGKYEASHRNSSGLGLSAYDSEDDD